jgi:hypothetical protein
MVFLSLFRQIQGSCFTTGYGDVFLHTFQFIMHYHSIPFNSWLSDHIEFCDSWPVNADKPCSSAFAYIVLSRCTQCVSWSGSLVIWRLLAASNRKFMSPNNPFLASHLSNHRDSKPLTFICNFLQCERRVVEADDFFYKLYVYTFRLMRNLKHRLWTVISPHN